MVLLHNVTMGCSYLEQSVEQNRLLWCCFGAPWKNLKVKQEVLTFGLVKEKRLFLGQHLYFIR